LLDEKPEAIIFAVTSSNHSNTRRNPLPLHLRSMILTAFADHLDIPAYVYPIDDIGTSQQFAEYTVKRINHESDGLFYLTPENTIVLCSTPVLKLYEQLGYKILPAELNDVGNWNYNTELPWSVVEDIACNQSWRTDSIIKSKIHSSSFRFWDLYKLGEKLQMLFRDTMISSDGDLTETRDYNVYVRQMDEIAELKFKDTADYIQPGRIGDIGCAVGSWIRLACKDPRLRESDFYGIEVSRHLFEICRQRKENGEFDNPFVFFSKKNAVTGLVFEPGTMNTIHTSSLTHEIESYGSREDLLKFIKNRAQELVPGGVWINRDVVGPYEKDEEVLLWLNDKDGQNDEPFKRFNSRMELSAYLASLSTHARFLRFSKDFRKEVKYQLNFTPATIEGRELVRLKLKDAMEFLSRKDYIDNWESEMHETFCYWDFDEWKQALKDAGFRIAPSSYAFTNDWIAKNRWVGKAELFRSKKEGLEKMDYPVTTMILVSIRE